MPDPNRKSGYFSATARDLDRLGRMSAAESKDIRDPFNIEDAEYVGYSTLNRAGEFTLNGGAGSGIKFAKEPKAKDVDETPIQRALAARNQYEPFMRNGYDFNRMPQAPAPIQNSVAKSIMRGVTEPEIVPPVNSYGNPRTVAGRQGKKFSSHWLANMDPAASFGLQTDVLRHNHGLYPGTRVPPTLNMGLAPGYGVGSAFAKLDEMVDLEDGETSRLYGKIYETPTERHGRGTRGPFGGLSNLIGNSDGAYGGREGSGFGGDYGNSVEIGGGSFLDHAPEVSSQDYAEGLRAYDNGMTGIGSSDGAYAGADGSGFGGDYGNSVEIGGSDPYNGGGWGGDPYAGSGGYGSYDSGYDYGGGGGWADSPGGVDFSSETYGGGSQYGGSYSGHGGHDSPSERTGGGGGQSYAGGGHSHGGGSYSGGSKGGGSTGTGYDGTAGSPAYADPMGTGDDYGMSDGGWGGGGWW